MTLQVTCSCEFLVTLRAEERVFSLMFTFLIVQVTRFRKFLATGRATERVFIRLVFVGSAWHPCMHSAADAALG